MTKSNGDMSAKASLDDMRLAVQAPNNGDILAQANVEGSLNIGSQQAGDMSAQSLLGDDTGVPIMTASISLFSSSFR